MIGGGYVGLELSQPMRRFGSKVSVIDRNDRLLHREDDDVTEALGSLFEDEAINTVLNARMKRVSGKWRRQRPVSWRSAKWSAARRLLTLARTTSAWSARALLAVNA